VAAIIAFLVWAYLSALIFLFDAYLNVSYSQFKRQQKEAVTNSGSPPSGGEKYSPTDGLG
jgi:uncharacterized BrkB/YihY/UPF0761 family membrane protein